MRSTKANLLMWQKQELLSSRIVAEYLAGNSGVHDSEGHQEEDFS